MLDKIGQFIDSFFDVIKDQIEWVLNAVLELFTSVFFFFYDIFLGFLENILTSDFMTNSSVQTALSSWSNLPPTALYLVGELNIHLMASAIAAAYGLRFLINILPASLTRV